MQNVAAVHVFFREGYELILLHLVGEVLFLFNEQLQLFRLLQLVSLPYLADVREEERIAESFRCEQLYKRPVLYVIREVSEY